MLFFQLKFGLQDIWLSDNLDIHLFLLLRDKQTHTHCGENKGGDVWNVCLFLPQKTLKGWKAFRSQVATGSVVWLKSLLSTHTHWRTHTRTH